MNPLLRLTGWCGMVGLIGWALSGCATPPTAEERCSSKSSMAEPEFEHLLTADGTWEIEWQSRPTPIPLNRPFDLIVYLQSSDASEALANATLEVNARMPHHRHGMTRRPRIVRRPDGGYDVTGLLFHMPGYWELHFDVTAHGVTERAQVERVLE